MVLLTVIVPQGLSAGDYVSIDSGDGQCFDVKLPTGFGPGDELPVEAPASPSRLPASPLVRNTTVMDFEQMMDFELVVPDGVVEGESFSVDTEFGTYDVQCPPGCSGGSAIVCQLPIVSHEEEQQAVADTGHKYLTGQRVQVLRSDGYTYSKGTIEYSYEGALLR